VADSYGRQKGGKACKKRETNSDCEGPRLHVRVYGSLLATEYRNARADSEKGGWPVPILGY
jgi:hypothetical protein